MIVTAPRPVASATASATAFVPASKGGISKTPIGPFHTTVPAAAHPARVATRVPRRRRTPGPLTRTRCVSEYRSTLEERIVSEPVAFVVEPDSAAAPAAAAGVAGALGVTAADGALASPVPAAFVAVLEHPAHAMFDGDEPIARRRYGTATNLTIGDLCMSLQRSNFALDVLYELYARSKPRAVVPCTLAVRARKLGN